MAKSFFIRHIKTGVQFVADSGKKVWGSTGAAKNAYGRSRNYHRQDCPLPTIAVIGRSGRVVDEVLRFDDQRVWELVELNDVASAESLLKRCLGRLNDSLLEEEIKEFLEE